MSRDEEDAAYNFVGFVAICIIILMVALSA